MAKEKTSSKKYKPAAATTGASKDAETASTKKEPEPQSWSEAWTFAKAETERKRVEAKMEDAKRRAAEAKGRVQRVEQSVESLASQAKKLESVLKENMANAAELNAREAAAKFQDAMAPSVTELELDDPLERKFRELEGR